MNAKDFDQLKSYSTLIVAELHKIVFDETAYSRLKPALLLAEELEEEILCQEKKRQLGAANVVKLRIA